MTWQRIRLLQITEHCIGGSLMAKAASDQNKNTNTIGTVNNLMRTYTYLERAFIEQETYLDIERKNETCEEVFIYQENNSSAGVRPTHQTSWTKQHRWCILPFLHFFFICQFFIFFCNYSVLVPNFQTDPRSSMLMSLSEVSPRSTTSKWWRLTFSRMFDFELHVFYTAFLIL